MTFREFLKKSSHIRESSITWLEKWVDLYKSMDSDLVKYSDFINEKYQEWQVRQAQTAVSFYHTYLESPDKGESEKGLSEQDLRNLIKKTIEQIRLHHLSFRTEKTYIYWLKRFISYCVENSIPDLSQETLKNFLSFLCISQNISSGTQSQAFNALLFVYRNILGISIEDLYGVIRAKRKVRFPVVLSRPEINMILSNLSDRFNLICRG